MKHKLILLFFLLLPVSGFCQQESGEVKKVAILEVVDKEGSVDYGVELMLRSSLSAAVTNTPGYEGYDRVDVAQIMGEQNFQRTGAVSDDQIKKLGEMTGASYILVAEAATLDAGHLFITAKILDVESARMEKTAGTPSGTTVEELETACNKLAASLFGLSSGSGSTSAYQLQQQTGTHRNGEVYNPDGIEMVYVEGTGTGIFATNGFYIGKYEVTQAQWKAVMGNNPSNFRHDNNPVESVSWNNIQQFIKKLNFMTGREYSLPTAAQWEYAARGGKNRETYEYAGSDYIDDVAWYTKNSEEHTHQVGTKLPNSLGIYDMSGNVWEWCSNCYYSSDSRRVVRGGGWNGCADDCKISDQSHNYSDNHCYDGGFRLVLVL